MDGQRVVDGMRSSIIASGNYGLIGGAAVIGIDMSQHFVQYLNLLNDWPSASQERFNSLKFTSCALNNENCDQLANFMLEHKNIQRLEVTYNCFDHFHFAYLAENVAHCHSLYFSLTHNSMLSSIKNIVQESDCLINLEIELIGNNFDERVVAKFYNALSRNEILETFKIATNRTAYHCQLIVEVLKRNKTLKSLHIHEQIQINNPREQILINNLAIGGTSLCNAKEQLSPNYDTFNDAVIMIATVLSKNNQSLKELSIRSLEWRTTCIPALCNMIESNQTLTNLSLTGHPPLSDYSPFLPSLKKNHKLFRFTLSHYEDLPGYEEVNRLLNSLAIEERRLKYVRSKVGKLTKHAAKK